MCSTPPASATSTAPRASSPAAAVTAVSAPAHIRSTAKPGTVSGSPARSATSRPSVRPWSPTCAVAAKATSPIRSGGISGFRRSSSRTAFTPRSSARVRQYCPFGPALPNGVRTPSTKKTSRASRMPTHDSVGLTDRSISLSYAPPVSWAEQARRAQERYEGGTARDLDQRQLTQLGNAAWAAGLCRLMDGSHDASRDWLRTAARRYRESWDAGAPPDSWGRPIAAMKALLLAGDDAREAAEWALEAGARDAASPIGVYAACLALLVLGEDVEARALGSTLRGRDDFPPAVAEVLAGFPSGIEAVLDSFEQR